MIECNITLIEWQTQDSKLLKDDTDNEVLKWCLLPDRTKIIIKVKQ